MKMKSNKKDIMKFRNKYYRLGSVMMMGLVFYLIILLGSTICSMLFLFSNKYIISITSGIYGIFVFCGMAEYQKLLCPKCGKKYIYGYWFSNLCRKKCKNCGFEMP
jgi:hypothetical protein